MTITLDELAAVERTLSDPEADGRVLAVLRGQFPHLSWTRCDAGDMVEPPFRSFARFDLHLLDTADHCAHITDDPTNATGLVLAWRGGAS
jgi:hypothetical protein